MSVRRIGLFFVFALGLPGSGVYAQAGPSTVIPPAEQAARDNDRVRILRDELARETRLGEENAKAKAERLAAKDPKGADERQEALDRNVENIRSLQREIDAAVAQAPGRSSPATVNASRVPAPEKAGAAGSDRPWWDVYARGPRRVEAAGLSNAGAAVPKIGAVGLPRETAR